MKYLNATLGKVFFYIISVNFVFFNSTAHSTEVCKESDVQLQVLGSGGPELSDGKASSSYIIWHKDRARVLIDAGPGSSVYFDKAKADFADLDAILLTHLHVDHSADIPAYIKGAYFSSRSRPLIVYGPDKNRLMPSTSEYLERLFGSEGAFSYLSSFLTGGRGANFKLSATDVPLTRDKVHHYQLSDDIDVQAIFTHHGPIASVAWKVEVGGCRITFSGDMSNQYEVLGQFAKGSDILVMNHAVPESARGAARNLHMPPSVIGEVAAKAEAKTLLLSHFMRRTLNHTKQSTALIKKHFDGNVKIAKDQLMIKLN
jgi:ribonuclease BN (tRNA processing enzyme)